MNAHPNSSTRTTQRRILPYQFTRLPNGKIRISMATGPLVIVSLDEAERILGREDLSTQRRTMYQAVLDWNDQDVEKWKDQDVQQ